MMTKIGKLDSPLSKGCLLSLSQAWMQIFNSHSPKSLQSATLLTSLIHTCGFRDGASWSPNSLDLLNRNVLQTSFLKNAGPYDSILTRYDRRAAVYVIKILPGRTPAQTKPAGFATLSEMFGQCDTQTNGDLVKPKQLETCCN
jgi:hypothetical protein